MSHTNGRGKICFSVPHLYPVTADGSIHVVGGSEIRHWALARELAVRGFETAVATCDYGQPRRVQREGVTLLRTYAPSAGLRGLRIFYPRLWKTMSSLREARADVYLAGGSGVSTGWAYDAARLLGSPFVFMSASDGDAMRSLPWLTKRRDKWWYLRALRGADERIAQSEPQRRLFMESFGLDAHVIANPIALADAPADVGRNRTVLWLSTYKESKRPDWFLELARRLPDASFVMIGAPAPAEHGGNWDEIERSARALPNLTALGYVEHERIGEFLREAAVFVHTSPLEGFPMTLLEAWSYGVPSVSCVDPGGAVTRFGVGELVSTVDALEHSVGGLLASPERRVEIGARARNYVASRHGPEATYEPFARLLDDVIARGRQSARRSGNASRTGRGGRR